MSLCKMCQMAKLVLSNDDTMSIKPQINVAAADALDS